MQFENLLLSSLMYREELSRKIIQFIDPDYFSEVGQRTTFTLIKYFFDKYKARPSKDALLIILSKTNLPESLYDPTATSINMLYDPTDDISSDDWMFDEAESWCKERALFNAMTRALSVMDGSDKTIPKDAMPSLLQKALAVRFDQSIGHDYIDDADKQYEYYQNPANKIPFRKSVLNEATKGGATRKTLSLVQAGINVGKTTWLLNMAADYAMDGLSGIYFTLEIDENVLRERLDVYMFGKTSEEIRAQESFMYHNSINAIKDQGFGKIVVKQFPPSSVHVGHLRHVCNEFETKHGKKPDFIIVDYITLLNSATLKPSMKSDSNGYYTNVAEELRALMIEMEAIGWSAQQFNRTGQDANSPKLSNAGLSIGVQATSDFTVAFVSPDEMKENKRAMGYILKNRFARKSAMNKFMIGIDDDLQIFYDVDDTEGTIDSDIKDKLDSALEMVDATKNKNQMFPTATKSVNLSNLQFN